MDADQPAAPNDNRPIRLSLLQVAAVAVAAVMVWQFVAVPQLSTRPSTFGTVSQDGEGHILQVVLRPETTIAETTTFL